jgi:hypothetical protein
VARSLRARRLLTQIIFSPSPRNGVGPPQAKNFGLLILQTAIFASVYKYIKVVGDMLLSSVHSNFMGRFTKISSFFPLFFPPEINFLRVSTRKIAGFWTWEKVYDDHSDSKPNMNVSSYLTNSAWNIYSSKFNGSINKFYITDQ